MTVIPGRKVTVIVEDTTLDLVCFEVALQALGNAARAGKLSGYVEAVLEANPGLAAHTILPLHREIILPDYQVPTPLAQHVRLWD